VAPNSGLSSEIEAALRLTRVPGLGSVSLSRLAKYFATATLFWEAKSEAWIAAGIPDRLFPALEIARFASVEEDAAEIARSGAWAVSLFDPFYPARLKEIYDPPPFLFGKGDIHVLGRECIAIVGSRRATRYGAEHAYRISRRLAEAGFIIISGLAVGIDAIAHQAALGALGTSVAVLGSGISNIYPSINKELALKLTDRGAIVSELRPSATADKVNFPRRNRVISGLSCAVVIIEAREDSGSLITAKQGIEQNREIFVVPGPAGGTNRGGHKLLSEGAHWAEDADDIIRVLHPSAATLAHAITSPEPSVEVPEAWVPIWNVVTRDPMHVDKVIEQCGLRSSQVLGILLQMELQGLVRQQSGKMFLRSR
jgi:DNA processing protein